MRASILLASALALAVTALPQPPKCSSPQCCKTVEKASSNPTTVPLLSLLGIIISNLDVPVGLSCTFYPVHVPRLTANINPQALAQSNVPQQQASLCAARITDLWVLVPPRHGMWLIMIGQSPLIAIGCTPV